MSEREFTPKPADERDKVAQLEAQLAKAKFDANQHEAFGKYDVTVPNVGEETYQSYLDKRSSDGVVRNGESLRGTANGKFASLSDYEESNGSTAEYDNAQLERQSENEVSYDSLSLQDLARKYGESEASNDKTMALDILEVLDSKMDEKAATNGWSKETKDLHYGQLMNIADRASRTVGFETDTVIPASEEDLIKAQELGGAQETDQSALEGESQEEFEARNGVKINTLENIVVSPLPNGDKINTLDRVKLAEVPEGDEKEEAGKEGHGSEETEAINSESAQKLEVEKQSIWKRISQKTSDLSVKAAATFGSTMFVIGNHIPAPKRKIDKDGQAETPEAFKKRVQRYGTAKVVGVVALLIAAKYGLPHLDLGDSGGSGARGADQGHGDYLDLPGSTGGDSGAGLEGVPVVPEFNTSAHTVTKGEGWYNTFKEMGITNATEQAKVLDKVGSQLEKVGWAYKIPNGSWGISHTGQLSDSVLKLIENNR